MKPREPEKLRIDGTTLKLPALFLVLFFGIAAWRYSVTGNAFYLWNFGYLGLALALGIFLATALPRSRAQKGRRVAQLLVGLYMLVYLGFLRGEDMQIEGFFFYLLAGVFAGASLHYLIAKVAGPLVFGRGWCGWACWTAMFLDFLPWKWEGRARRNRGGYLRYIHFFASLGLVLYLGTAADGRFFFQTPGRELRWLVLGNAAYYAAGLFLAAALRDNRAFCKYLCPIPVLQKPGARFSLIKPHIDPAVCVECGACERACPMDVPLLEYTRQGRRIDSTECVLCLACVHACPKGAVSVDTRRLRVPLRG